MHGFDGCIKILRRAQELLARFGERFQAWPFDPAARSWREVDDPAYVVVTSLRSIILAALKSRCCSPTFMLYLRLESPLSSQAC